MSEVSLRGTVTIAIVSLLSACAVGPNYHRPKVDAAASYKEAGDWKPSEPNDVLDRGNWWEVFRDDDLNKLESKVDISNQTVRAAADAFDQSRALLSEARAGFWPTIGASVSKVFSGGGSGAAVITGAGGTGTGGTGTTGTGTTGTGGGGTGSSLGLLHKSGITDTAGLSGSWDLDIWGKIRRTTEGARATAQASAAALAAARLSAQAQLATDYFELRAQDQLQKLLDDTVEAETQSLHITESRYKFGVAARADVVSAETQLLASQAQQVNAKIQRGVLEHAVAVLIGQQPASFALAASTMRTDVPTVPAGVPSALLERRPDVAESERNVASANAQIGVAEAAYFPDLTLTGSDDYSSNTFRHLISLPNRVWSWGPSLAETLIDGGLRHAQVSAARAQHDVTVDNYRQTVLTAFQQVEDDIVTLRVLEQQAVIEDKTVAAAREAEKLTLNQYKAGTVPYSSVIAAQTTRLSAEQTALSVLSQRLQTSVALVEALGGGWKAQDLPLP
ncbi:MAG TPA: efflux transporter outer membrane subunit [Steroidobacteraceae bacterium]|jgi:NodT family efflux transporter outer membrane factor (OMF) lipoprotein|nr:efflux transporter outer membrane subunit [Steroidobacteraceae bacterium]